MIPMVEIDERATENAAWERSGEPPLLSILAPFWRHDPSPLIEALGDGPKGLPIELILIDDGTQDCGLIGRVLQRLEALTIPAQLILRRKNRGRSQARNRLVAAARARHMLFLDADMEPRDPRFAPRWLDLIAAEDPTVAFGGFSVAEVPDTEETALHKHLSGLSDCLPASVRAKSPAQYVTTSNLLVRRDVLDAAPFDEGFVGWGYEDVEWALRAEKLGPILHIDNPAIHLGLDAPAALIRKSREGGPNYARLAARHPEAVKAFASYRAAAALRRTPGHALARPLLTGIITATAAPLAARGVALKLLRASYLAEALP
jgi:glycosyltransferase involved in cell wall biosynthesis